MNKCTKCGYSNPAENIYCEQCGQKLVVTYSKQDSSHFANNPFEDTSSNSSKSANSTFADNASKSSNGYNSPFEEDKTKGAGTYNNPFEEMDSKKATSAPKSSNTAKTTSSGSSNGSSQQKTSTANSSSAASSNTNTSSAKTYTPQMSASERNARESKIILAVVFVGVLFFAYIFFAVIFYSFSVSVRKIEVGESSKNLLEMDDYLEVEEYFEDAGFVNIDVVGEGDVVYDNEELLGEVIEITINDDDKFKSSDSFPMNAEIIIYYHSAADIEVESASTYEGKNYEEVVDMLHEAGFFNIELKEHDDLILGLLNSEGEVESVSFDGDQFYYEGEEFPADATVVITYHTFPD